MCYTMHSGYYVFIEGWKNTHTQTHTRKHTHTHTHIHTRKHIYQKNTIDMNCQGDQSKECPEIRTFLTLHSCIIFINWAVLKLLGVQKISTLYVYCLSFNIFKNTLDQKNVLILEPKTKILVKNQLLRASNSRWYF